MIHIGKKRTIHRFFNILKFCKEHYSVETTDGQTWPNYIGPKRDNPQVCLTRPGLHPLPAARWEGGYSVVTCHGPLRQACNANSDKYKSITTFVRVYSYVRIELTI